ncbi:MAG TPA: hypothetical protein VK187_14460, partial [Geobacteraceae bacterium]|nr:hypothetical protein [Geobacteraceae bacterium]
GGKPHSEAVPDDPGALGCRKAPVQPGARRYGEIAALWKLELLSRFYLFIKDFVGVSCADIPETWIFLKVKAIED